MKFVDKWIVLLAVMDANYSHYGEVRPRVENTEGKSKLFLSDHSRKPAEYQNPSSKTCHNCLTSY